MPLQAPVNSSSFLKASDFEDGKILTVAAAPEQVKSNNPEYGNAEGNTTSYQFTDANGNEWTFQNYSNAFANAFNGASLEIGDEVEITRSGSGKTTTYSIKKV